MDKYSRRAFITKIFRTGSLLSLAAISGYLIFGRQEVEACDFSFVCRNCKKLKDCSLPEAENFKEVKQHESI